MGLIFKTVEAKIGLIFCRESTESRVNDQSNRRQKESGEGHWSPRKI